MYDIFNGRGAFIARTALRKSERNYPLTAVAQKGRLYCLEEKEDGYRELVVYRMSWQR